PASQASRTSPSATARKPRSRRSRTWARNRSGETEITDPLVSSEWYVRIGTAPLVPTSGAHDDAAGLGQARLPPGSGARGGRAPRHQAAHQPEVVAEVGLARPALAGAQARAAAQRRAQRRARAQALHRFPALLQRVEGEPTAALLDHLGQRPDAPDHH